MNYFDVDLIEEGMRVRLHGTHNDATYDNFQGTVCRVYYNKEGRKVFDVRWDRDGKESDQGYNRRENDLALKLWDISFGIFQKDIKKLLTEE